MAKGCGWDSYAASFCGARVREDEGLNPQKPKNLVEYQGEGEGERESRNTNTTNEEKKKGKVFVFVSLLLTQRLMDRFPSISSLIELRKGTALLISLQSLFFRF